MIRNDKTRNIILIVLAVCLIGLTIAYAVMSDRLKISGVANVGKSEWKIHFDNLKAPTITGSAEKGTATLDSSKTTLTVSDGVFKAPGDKITYIVDVVNEGDIDAEVEIVSTNIGKCESTDGSDVEKYCDKIKAELVYLDTNEEVKVKDELNKGESKTLKFTISYDENRDLTSVPNTSIVLDDITSSITYTMKTDSVSSGGSLEEVKNNNVCTANKDTAVSSNIICKRAETLHTEVCEAEDDVDGWYCTGAGYTGDGSKGTSTIIYGNCGTSGTLTSGDAFDCDVNGDGVYDSKTERFYYVSDYYDTTSKTFDSNYATLIYYINVASGIPNSRKSIDYYEKRENWHGPLTAILELPTTTQWSNVTLKSATRAILTEVGTTSTPGGTLPTAFSYSGYAARLLTTQEVSKACNVIPGDELVGELENCNYLFENTTYSYDPEIEIKSGYRLENPDSNDQKRNYCVCGSGRYFDSNQVAYDGDHGIRPAIDVAKTNISY